MSAPYDPPHSGQPDPAGPYRPAVQNPGPQNPGPQNPDSQHSDSQHPDSQHPDSQHPDSQFQQPQPGPYPQQPGPSGSPGLYGPYGQPAGYDQYDQYAYNPYGSASPARPDRVPPPSVSRPGIMILSLVLLLLSALPFLATGLVLVTGLFGAQDLPPNAIDADQLAGTGVTIEQLFQVVGGMLLGTALVYIGFTVVAFTGRNWARIVLTILTVGFAMLLLAGLVGGGAADVANLVFLLLVLLASLGGVGMMFLADANRFFTARSAQAR